MSCIAIAINNFSSLFLLLLFFCLTVMISDNIFTYTHKIATFLLTSRCSAYVTLYILVRTHWIQAFRLFARYVLYGRNRCKTLTFISNAWGHFIVRFHIFFSLSIFSSMISDFINKWEKENFNDTLIIHFNTYE